MGSHRADPRAGRRRSTAPEKPTTTPYVGKRVAGRQASPAAPPAAPEIALRTPAPVATPAVAHRAPAVKPDVASRASALHHRAPTVELPALGDIEPFDPLTDSSSQLRAVQPSGKRRAVSHAGRRGPLFKSLPTMPVAVGVATLAVAVGGVVVSSEPQLAASATDRLTAPNAMTGSFGTVTSAPERVPVVSRDSDRDTLARATGGSLEAEAKRHAAERTSALGQLAKDAEKEAAEIALNRWVLPLSGYRLTATFGEYGLWSSYHTGLDFAAPSGTPLRATTNGTITSTGFDGAYGNKTVITLDDGTELWYCHQSAVDVSTGDKVRAGEVIGYVGSTGHVTGPHLHLEVRPGGGDPVDPDAALRVHGVTP